MLKNFQLTAIVKAESAIRLLRIPLHQGLQQTLAESWGEQYGAFIDEVQEINFNAGYHPEEHERFRLLSYALPEWLARENSRTTPDLEAISKNDELVDSIKGIAAFVRISGGELILFQNFTRSHVIRPGHFLFLNKDIYETTHRPGLTLDIKLSAVYIHAERKLLFHNFRTVNTFLPLADFYEEASEQEIREVLAHRRLVAEDADALATESNQWFRKRFAMLKDSGVLDTYSGKEIQVLSEGYDVEILLSKGRIVFPKDKRRAKKILQFLNEELFRGAITKALYETNSKREAD